jgi:hypothetical protein
MHKEKTMTDYIILQPIHLGNGELGRERKKALVALAARSECFWNGEPSIGRWLIALADEFIREEKEKMKDSAPIVQQIIENGLVQSDEELKNQFEFFAGEVGWSDDEIEQALKSPWFPSVENPTSS